MRKQIVDVKEVPSGKAKAHPWYRLKLECGHTVYRKKNPMIGPPRYALCAFCKQRVKKRDSE